MLDPATLFLSCLLTRAKSCMAADIDGMERFGRTKRNYSQPPQFFPHPGGCIFLLHCKYRSGNRLTHQRSTLLCTFSSSAAAEGRVCVWAGRQLSEQIEFCVLSKKVLTWHWRWRSGDEKFNIGMESKQFALRCRRRRSRQIEIRQCSWWQIN